ncbi:TPA: Lrp/AsnC family transcriptional regulator [Candidatus Woesearchaeota archaeon]|nr:Lrp/AsnC family transcriptional regulator [Candidatus Woesearchaeota archaeon]HIH32558.1 Lrp/AsnC family transcriptional regulator [Candidatus Woesearchaeota archaeon]HIH54899.1 Lrp/AsnC family transcriptional regulator [Candidatus Woesearchaeota archaeon]HIJ01742.1 Lrp/AsnC family transcriptional regulator [Candidatus Woesearchaeota archaeon]HIJ13944.1 Lrp/AsnC family transcriptional regulator [Candidatus Woesearchaeota archaeon]
MYQLDVKDRKILSQLDINARQSNAEIGKKVRLSKEVVKYRIDNLINNGVIIRFHTVINYFKLGVQKHKLYLQLQNVDDEKIEEIVNYFHNHKKTEWLVQTTGKWDMIIGFLVNNINELDDEITIFMNKYHNYIRNKAITITLNLVHHVREYLSPEKQGKYETVYHTTKDKKEAIDDLDTELLRLLANNARMQVTEIAKRLKTTARIIQYRIRQLEQKEIILAYKLHLDPRAIGNIFCKAIFTMSSMTKDQLDKFISYSSGIKEAVWPQKVIGNWDFELDLEVEDYEAFQRILSDIKNHFSNIIQQTEFCITSKEYKLDLFPNAYPTYN